MKTLMLLRHGKSDWDADYGSDHERPLAKRGEKAAKKVGRFVKAIDEVPELVVSSTAERAHRTALIAKEAGKWACEIRSTGRLYEASPLDLLDVLREIDESVECVMLVGHEPTWSSTINMLTGANVRFPTAALARIDFARDSWASIGMKAGQLAWFVVPKSLPDL